MGMADAARVHGTAAQASRGVEIVYTYAAARPGLRTRRQGTSDSIR
jgi:hypothetical protein